MKLILTLIGFLLSLTLTSQTIIEDSIWFEHDISFRKLKVWLPENYDSSITYQTVYCLDAELLFPPLVSSVEIYS